MALPARDDEKSRIDRGYEEGFNSGNNAYVEAGLDQAEAYANDPQNHKNQDDVKNAEQDGAGWDTDIGGGGKSGDSSDKTQRSFKDRAKSALRMTKKKSAIGVILAIFGIGGGAMVGVFGPTSMLINLTENFRITNDSSSTAMQSRFMKIFGHMTGGDISDICTSSTNSKMKCGRMGRLSNSAIRSLNKEGVVALDADGKEMQIKRTGYPDKNPTKYRMPNGDVVQADNLVSYLSDGKNSKVARQIMGTGGAFNPKAQAWTGKHITNKLYSKFRGIDRRGGFANGQNKGDSVDERRNNLKEKTKSHLASAADTNNISSKISDKAKGNLNKAGKGGAAYVISVAGCVAVKAPSYIAAGIAAVQLAQIIPMANNMVMSPGHKAKAMDISADDMDVIGSTLTHRTENADGKMTSALDSKYLLAAMGVNTAKPAVSKFAPGYGVMNSSIVKASAEVDDALEGPCNVITSPAAMWTATAVSSAATVALSTTLIGGVIKIGVDVGVSLIAQEAASYIVGRFAADAIQKIAESEDIPNAEGEELGDVIGLGAMSFFSAGGMARSLPVLSESQVVAYDQVRQENESFNRQMDVASLSPFDTLSRYTFLGSIVNSMQMASITSNSNSPIGLISSLLKTPSLVSSTASATLNQSQNMCGYAEQFGMDTGDPNTTPAINAAGLPCTGITPTQAGMSTAEAIQLLESEGWVDDSKDIAEDATIDDLMGNYIKENTPLYEFITTCSDASTGDYLYNSAGCIVQSDVGSTDYSSACYEAEDGNRVCSGSVDMEGNSEIEGVKNPRSMQAMSVFLIDFQLAQSINGFDVDDGSGGAASDSTGGLVAGDAGSAGRPDGAKTFRVGWTFADGQDVSSVPCAAGTVDAGLSRNTINDVDLRICSIGGKEVSSVISESVVAMFKAAKSDGITLSLGSGYRSTEKQQQLYNQNCSGGICSPPTARPGSSQHEMGLALDIAEGGGGTICFPRPGSQCSSAAYKWLVANAKKYGFFNLPSEAWHWSTSGG